jgi:hypothetical protein
MGEKMKRALRIFMVFLVFLLPMAPSGGADDAAALAGNEFKELAAFWNIFRDATAAGDVPAVKALSCQKIRCLSCVDNTEREEKEMERFMSTEPDWYEKLYTDKIFIPVETFCAQDLPILLTRKLADRMRNAEPAYHVMIFNGQRVYEAMIPTAEPGEITPGDEGGLCAFQFIETEQGLKFWGLDTIP